MLITVSQFIKSCLIYNLFGLYDEDNNFLHFTKNQGLITTVKLFVQGSTAYKQ